MNLCALVKAVQTGRPAREPLDFSAGFPHTLRMKIVVSKTGAIWHGTVEGHAEIDERGLTEEVARRKVEQLLARRSDGAADGRSRSAAGSRDGLRGRSERRREEFFCRGPSDGDHFTPPLPP